MGRNGLQYGNAKRSRPLLDNRGFRADIRLRFIMQLSDLDTTFQFKKGFMTWTEIILYTVFILVVAAFALLGVMRGETNGSRLQMTPDEVSYVMRNLEKRSAADCVLTRTDDGNFVCKEMGSNKIFKVRVK